MRSVRTHFVALLFAIAVLAPAPSLHAAPAGPVPDTSGVLTTWQLQPATPCAQDSLFMIVRGYVATPCDSFLGAEAISPLFVRIRRQEYIDRRCFSPPTEFYPVPVALGRFAAGPHMGIVEVETVQMQSNGSSTRVAQQYRFDFVVAAECTIPPTPGLLPYVHTIGTEPPRPCAGRPTSLVINGEFSDGCGRVIDAYVRDPQHVELTLKPRVLPDTACTLALKPWRQDFNLGPLPSGPHRTNITLHVLVPNSSRTGFERHTYYGSHDFFVLGDCDSIMPPVPGPLPYVRDIVVGRDASCGPVPACPGESILVRVDGLFPSNCFMFRRIELIPPILQVVPLPPPIVRIIVDDGCCLGRPCFDVPTPWSAAVKLPPMAAGDYRLGVELAQVCCSDAYPPGQLYHTAVPFAVADSCPRPACLMVDFAPGPGNLTACNATVATGHPAELTFLVRPTVALAGLQGEFRLNPSVLTITRIEPIGPAEGMLLDWTPTSDGARFVLFAKSGAPIPPIPLRDTREIAFGGWPVLRVTVEHLRRGAPPPERTVVTTENLLGADIDGGAVLLCPPPPCVDADPRFSSGRALICGERACDFNADGLQDVRDLVLMVHCANGDGACPPDAGLRFDCDGDGTFAIADVICCARNVLQRPPCPGCPPDTGQVRPEPGMAVTFGAPQESAGGIEIPVLITGADRLGAAMLTLEAPLDRYDVTGFDVNPPGNWLALHEVRDGRLVLGMIEIRGGPHGLPAERQFTLVLALRPGQPAGGQVTAVGGEFSGPDGVTLAVELGRPTQTLPGGAQLALGQNQPNPFSTETAFTLQLVEAADVVVGIYDLRGRVVASLHRAPLPSGPHMFRWNGRRSDATAAPNGIYFYQATVGGKSLARKLILMRGD